MHWLLAARRMGHYQASRVIRQQSLKTKNYAKRIPKEPREFVCLQLSHGHLDTWIYLEGWNSSFSFLWDAALRKLPSWSIGPEMNPGLNSIYLDFLTMVLLVLRWPMSAIYSTGLIEESLEAKLPTIWTDEKALKHGRSSDVEKMRNGEDTGARKGSEVAKLCVFPMFCGSGGSKSN